MLDEYGPIRSIPTTFFITAKDVSCAAWWLSRSRERWSRTSASCSNARTVVPRPILPLPNSLNARRAAGTKEQRGQGSPYTLTHSEPSSCQPAVTI